MTFPKPPQSPPAWLVPIVGSATDAELLRATAAGSADSFDALYRRHAPMIGSRLRRRCSDRDLTDEVLQDTFLAVWRGASRWSGTGEVQAWIWGIAVRRLADALRRQLNRPQPTPSPERTMASAEDAALREMLSGELSEAMDRLDVDLRLVVNATVLDQLSTREAAGLLGVPQGTVKTRMMRARAKLRQGLI